MWSNGVEEEKQPGPLEDSSRCKENVWVLLGLGGLDRRNAGRHLKKEVCLERVGSFFKGQKVKKLKRKLVVIKVWNVCIEYDVK